VFEKSSQIKNLQALDLPGFEDPKREATTRFELVIRVLQTHALPLGYVALSILFIQAI
jgi:hypothetical protein